MQIELTQSDLATITAAIDVQRAYLKDVILITSGNTEAAAVAERAVQDDLRKRLNPEPDERAQFYWCHAPHGVWDRCHRGCWSGCNHIDYTRVTAIQHTVSVGDRVTGVILKPENSD